MAYDKALADRVRALFEKEPASVEKKMFGGVCFMINGNISCGILNAESAPLKEAVGKGGRI